MKMNQRMKSLTILLFGLLLLAPAGWAHDDKDKDRKGRRDGWGRAASEYGIDRGYQDGVRHGREDRLRRAGYNYRNNEWRKADRGYDKSMGAKGQYKQGYRDGYVRGYEEAYYGRNVIGGWGMGRNGDDARRRDDHDGDDDRRHDDRDEDDVRSRRSPRSGFPDNNGGYGDYNSNRLVQAAQQNGLQSGAYYAQRDRSQGNAYNPTGAKGYRDADQGYDDSLGSKADYQRIFRENFVRGYQQAYGNVGYRR